MQVRAGLVGRRYAVDGAGELAVDEDDALVAFPHLRDVALHHDRLAEGDAQKLDERIEIGVALRNAEHRGAAIAVKRLHHDVLVLVAEGADGVRRAGDERWRHQIEKVEHEHLLRRIAHARWVVDHERLGLEALQEMRRGDIGHVEGRVLAEMHHVERGKVDAARMRQAVMVAGTVLYGEAVAFGHQLAIAKGEMVRGVIEHVVAAPLRLEQEREGGIAPDIDALYGVHLEGDFESHGAPYRQSLAKGELRGVKRERRWRCTEATARVRRAPRRRRCRGRRSPGARRANIARP